MSNQVTDNSLRKSRLGVLGIVFFVVAASAPLVGMTGAVPVAIVLGNQAAVPGAYLLVGLVLLLFSVGFTAMTSKVTNAGAFFAYIGRGLGKNVGIGSAMSMIVGYVTIQLAIYGFMGQLLHDTKPFGMDLPWYLWSIIAWVLVTALSLLSVDIGAKVLGILMLLEVVSLLISGIAILVNNAGALDFAASFSPTNIFAGGFAGGAGIAIAFALASYIGFEATAIYGEEAKDPKRAVPRATYWAVGIITAVFTVVSFGVIAGLNSLAKANSMNLKDQTVVLSSVDPSKGDLLQPQEVLFTLTSTYVGSWLVSVMQILVVSSLFAGLLAFQNANSRYVFALGRAKVLPKAFGSTNKLGAPQGGVVLTSVLALIIMVIFAIQNLAGIQMFSWMSAVTAIAIMLVELLVSVAVIAYFRKNKGTHIFKAVIAPAISAVALGLGLYLLMSRFNLLSTLAVDVDSNGIPVVWSLTTLGWFLVLLPFIALVIGIIWGLINKKDEGKLSEDILS